MAALARRTGRLDIVECCLEILTTVGHDDAEVGSLPEEGDLNLGIVDLAGLFDSIVEEDPDDTDPSQWLG